MKILFVIDQLAGGGRERRLVQLIRGLNAYNIGIYIILFRNVIKYNEIKETNAKFHILNSTNRLEQIKKIRSIVVDTKPNIIHNWIETPTECIILPLLARCYGAKYIAGFVADGNSIQGLTNRLSIAFTFKMADVIISNSRAGLIAKNAALSKSRVIYNGFDFNRIPQDSKSEIRKSLNLESTYIVTMCARVSDAKDWEMFINLANRADIESLDISFLAVGSGDKLDYFKQKITQQGYKNIHFIGQRGDVEKIIKASDVCVLFTKRDAHAEGVSNYIMECMATGKPVIATDGGGTPEIIDNNKDGFIITPSDEDKAFGLLKQILMNRKLSDYISNNAVEKIKNKFLLSSMSKQYMSIYNELLSK